MFLSALFFHEPFSLLNACGIAILFVGIVLMNINPGALRHRTKE